MMTVEEQKLYLDFGFDTFADFLTKSEISRHSKTQFYKLRELYLTEGPERLRPLHQLETPADNAQAACRQRRPDRARGDEVVIGGEERINVGETKAIKADYRTPGQRQARCRRAKDKDRVQRSKSSSRRSRPASRIRDPAAKIRRRDANAAVRSLADDVGPLAAASARKCRRSYPRPK
jgi:hypothetical protein